MFFKSYRAMRTARRCYELAHLEHLLAENQQRLRLIRDRECPQCRRWYPESREEVASR